ncbi:MAG TPA: glycosyltransferase family 39 protein [Kofleriaceae bacterium]|jgi:4-amino-4-deoxy-L-arabinose transferase-like glycosyltransferase|nr:glycosyltransferase family 39 protein [Kofleriaceae bacterium]
MSTERDAAGRPFSTFELWVVTLVCLAFLLPGIWSYSLIDPWETHYGEVARRMLRDHDWVHTDWQHEGFRSKPVLTFWLMASSMKLFHVAPDGGYSGEMVSSGWIMFVVRLPFVLVATAALVAVWKMLATLVSRRVAYLAIIAIASCPFYCLVARQAITDMPLAACLMGAMAAFAMATESGDAPLRPRWRIKGYTIDSRHVFFLIVGGFVVAQALYYFFYFLGAWGMKPLAIKFAPWMPHPALLVSGAMLIILAGLHSYIGPFSVLSLPPILVWLAMNQQRRPAVLFLVATALVWFGYAAYRYSHPIVQRLWRMLPIKTERQVHMLWFWALLGVSVLAKGPPAVAVAGVACAFYVVLLHKWRALLDGEYEIKRGILIFLVIAIPWHVVMWMRDGQAFINEYIGTHLLSRASVAELGSKGTFDYYLPQIGYGMYIWAALLPGALAAVVLRTGTRTREDRVRILVALWAIAAVAFFCIIQTKFHHYILPGIPAFAILVAFWMDDVLAGRERTPALYAVLGAAICLLIARDLMWTEKSWIEMFVFRYDRPWPTQEPWQVDATDGFLGLGLAGAGAILLFAFPSRFRAFAVAFTCAAGLAVGLWAMHVYMPVAGTHWGQGDAIRNYYEQREIYGMRVVYYDRYALERDWNGTTTWTIETLVPDHIFVGQPMALRVTLRDPEDRQTIGEARVRGTVSAVHDHSIDLALDPADAKQPMMLLAKAKDLRESAKPTVYWVDADRLIAWQLYWRGEVFWSGDEVWGPLPDLRADWQLETNNQGINKLLADPVASPPGRRYFVITEAGRISGLKALLPAQHADGTPSPARDTFEVLDTTSNKFSLCAFVL